MDRDQENSRLERLGRWRWLGSPWVLAAVVVAWLGLWIGTRGGTNFAQPVLNDPVLVEQTKQGMVASDPNGESWDRATRLLSGAGGGAWMVRYQIRVEPIGWPFAVKAEALHIISIESPISLPGLDQAIRRAAVDEYVRLRVIGDDDLAMGLRGADVVRTRHLWLGWVCNAATLVAALIAGYGVTQLPRHVREWRSSRRRKSLDRGECPVCRYRLEGLNADTCPECGEALGTRQ